MSLADVLHHLDETLELPGGLADYHYAIQGVVELLWSRRREDPAALNDLERLAWLSIRLVRSHPEIIAQERTADGGQFLSVTALGRLQLLYMREGALADALDVARIAERFDQGTRLEDLETRIGVEERSLDL